MSKRVMRKTVGSLPEAARSKPLAKFASAIVIAAVLTGCNSTSQMDNIAGLDSSAVETEKPAKTYGSVVPTQKTVLKTKPVKVETVTSSYQQPEVLRSPFFTGGDAYREASQIRSELSPHCRKILAETGIETTILRSPTANGSYNTDNDISLGLSYQLTDFSKANLKEELALARCSRDIAAVKLSQLLVTSRQSLTRSGFLAKANYLRKSRGKLARIRNSVSRGLNNGSMTRVHANVLREYIEVIRGTEAQAQGEAAKRKIVDRIQKRNFANLDNQLLDAEQRIQDIQSRLRTVDGVNVTASVSYAKAGSSSADRTLDRDGSVTGKVKFSVKLGTFANRRYELEEISKEASLARYHEADRGALWRAKELAKANRVVMVSLSRRKQDVLRALKQAKSSAALSVTDDQPELLMAKIRAQVSVIALTSNLVGLQATINDTRRVDQKLKFRN